MGQAYIKAIRIEKSHQNTVPTDRQQTLPDSHAFRLTALKNDFKHFNN